MAQSGKTQLMTFEEALAKLEGIVEAIEQGKIGLEESIVRYEEGMKLIQHCRKIIGQAELKIQKLQAGADGQLQPEPFAQPADQPDPSP
jgi:exodeoxyribonuclease VII small subunit